MHVNPHELVKDQLVDRIASLENVQDADALTFIGPLLFGVDDAIRDKWHSHGRGISMAIARKELELLIDDFGEDERLNMAIRSYYRRLKNFMVVLGQTGTVHTRERFTPL